MFHSTRGRHVACVYLGRAARIALLLHRDPAVISDTIRSFAQRLADDADGQLVGLLHITRDVVVRDPALATWFLKTVESLTTERASGKHHILERSLLEAIIPIATEHGGVVAARALRERIAQSLEDEAQERAHEGGIVQSSLLQRAIKAYADLGKSDKIALLKPLLHQATQRSTEEMQRVSTTITIPVEKLAAQVDYFLKVGAALAPSRGPAAHFLPFTRATTEALWPAWDTVKAQTAELAEQFPFQHLVAKVVITADGRPHERPADPEQAREFEEIQHYLQMTWLSLMFIRHEVDLLRERGAWTHELLLQALARGTIFDDRLLATIQPGVQAFEAGRHWEALHVLVPQIERAIRKLAVALGADARRYIGHTGELRWASLKELLADDRLLRCLAKIAPDLAKELGVLLIDSRGMNLRDDLAHGILPAEVDAEGHGLLCILILLTLSTLVSSPEPTPGTAAEPEATQ